MILIFAFDYTKVGNSGGWSKSAKHKPQPILAVGHVEFEQVTGGEIARKEFTAIAAGSRRRKFTAFDMSTTPPTLLRRDYGMAELRELGAKIPDFYFDEIGNIRGKRDELIFKGPGTNIQ